jgi:ferritin
MEMKDTLIREFNKQINEELYSAYLYIALSAKCSELNFNGMAKWLKLQAEEEIEHAQKFYNHLIERGAKVDLMTIAQPKLKGSKPVEFFRAAYEHEKHISARIDKLVEVAKETNDTAAYSLLQWFVNEQIEEENTTFEAYNMLKMAGDNPTASLMLDSKLGARKED